LKVEEHAGAKCRVFPVDPAMGLLQN
jgi:hypothetical protein